MKDKAITIQLVEQKAYIRDKTGKKIEAKSPTGDLGYIRNDLSGLQMLLGRFDTKMHSIKDWKMWMKTRDKVTDCYLNDKKRLELSLDEASFLKDYLTELAEKHNKDSKIKEEEKISFREGEVRTLLGILEQFEE